VNDTERYLFLALIEAVEDIELLFHPAVRRSREGAPGGGRGRAGAESGVDEEEGGADRAEAGARTRTL